MEGFVSEQMRRREVGLGMEFRLKKIPRNRLGSVSVIPRRKCSFRGIPSSAEEPIPKLGMKQNGTEFREKFKFTEQSKYWTKWLLTRVVETNSYGLSSKLFSLPRNGSEQNSESLLQFLFHGTEFWVVSLPLKGSEGNSESLLLFLFHGTEFRVVFSSAGGFGTEFRRK
jgi:hypothetical protein